jgi:anti-anti-sigma factor
MPVERLVITPAVVERDVVLSLAGDLDMDGETALLGAVGDLIGAGYPRVVVDCSKVSFCDSRGFNALLRARQAAEEAGGAFALAAVREQLRSLLELLGADQLFLIAATVEQGRLLVADAASGSQAEPA